MQPEPPIYIRARCTDEFKRRVNDYAASKGLSESDVVRLATQEYLEREEPKLGPRPYRRSGPKKSIAAKVASKAAEEFEANPTTPGSVSAGNDRKAMRAIRAMRRGDGPVPPKSQP